MNERTSLKYPELYILGQEGKLFNLVEFTKILAKGFLTSIFLFFVTYFTVHEMESQNGTPIDYNVFQATLQTQVNIF